MLEAADAGAAAYREEATRLERLAGEDAAEVLELVRRAIDGDPRARTIFAAVRGGAVADDLRTELREKGARTAARLAQDLELPLGAVLVAALALHVGGEARVVPRPPRGRRGLAVLGRAFVAPGAL